MVVESIYALVAHVTMTRSRVLDDLTFRAETGRVKEFD
jgi:hypothetical protein